MPSCAICWVGVGCGDRSALHRARRPVGRRRGKGWPGPHLGAAVGRGCLVLCAFLTLVGLFLLLPYSHALSLPFPSFMYSFFYISIPASYIYLSTYPSYICSSVHPPAHPSPLSPSLFLFVRLSTCPSVYLVCPSHPNHPPFHHFTIIQSINTYGAPERTRL